jgi:carboxyl-terminal processing protease
MVKSLKDPYTIFLTPQDTKRFLEDVSGKFEGVGMEIGIKKGQLTVIAPLEGTPAQKAGIKAGDKIIKIDDRLTLEITLDEAVNLIRGPKGTEVKLTILREDEEKTREITITRAVIKIPSLKWEILEDNIAYIKIYHFTQLAESDFKKAAIEIIESPADYLILDLRNNPGGYLEVAANIAGWFLPKGKIVAIEDFGNNEKKPHKSRGPSKLQNYPTVVIINKGSASGAEILAAALRDNQKAIIIGEKSFGKGSVQEISRLSDNSSLKITVAKWLTPKGELIEEVGIEPDIFVKLTQENFENDKDPQLDKAIEVVKGLR